MDESANSRSPWSSPRYHYMALISQITSLGSSIFVPEEALLLGATGYILVFIVSGILVGIPLVYMEMVIGQFSGKDFLKVWSQRPILVYLGYVLLFWWLYLILFFHVYTSFLVHYLLTSLEVPILFYICGVWATPECNILAKNFTLNEVCVKNNNVANPLCLNMELFYPEAQYWEYRIIYATSSFGTMSWRSLVASAIIVASVFFSIFKGKRSMEMVLPFLTIYPYVAHLIILTTGLLQNGISTTISKVMDSNFKVFVSQFSCSQCAMRIVNCLSIGTGVLINLSSKSNFRTHCYKHAVFVVLTAIGSSILFVVTTAVIYAAFTCKTKYDERRFISSSMHLPFVKIPMGLKVFSGPKAFWLMLYFSSNAVMGFRCLLMTIYSLMRMGLDRSAFLKKYRGLSALFVSFTLFIGTVSFLGAGSIKVIWPCNEVASMIFLLASVCQVGTFIWLYGLTKFCDDIHFMLGIPAGATLRILWAINLVFLLESLANALYTTTKRWLAFEREDVNMPSFVLFYGSVLLVLLCMTVHALWYKIRGYPLRKLWDIGFWGPDSELLYRSRTMFSRHAMTREYLYRQFKLRSGIQDRQQRSGNYRGTNHHI